MQTPLGRRRKFDPRFTARKALAEVLAAAESDAFKLGLRRLWDLSGSRLVLAAETTAVLEADQADASELAHEARRVMMGPCDDLPWPIVVDIGGLKER